MKKTKEKSRKKLRFIAFILLLCILLSGCQPENQAQNPGKPADFVPSGEKVESAIFGRNISFNSYTPRKDIVLPVETKEIIDIVQINKNLYILVDGAVYSLNTETGDSIKLFDTASKMLTAYEETLYTVDSDSKAVLSYSEKGELLDTKAIGIEDVIEIYDIILTDDYYVLQCKAVVKGAYTLQLNVFDKQTGDKVNSINEKNYSSYISGVNKFAYSYKDNSILFVEEDTVFNWLNLYAIDVKTGDHVMKAELTDITKTSNFDLAYNPRTDTVIAFAGLSSERNSYYTEISPDEAPLTISEYSLSDPDNILHQKFYFDNPVDAKLFVSIHENIISAICTCDNEYRYFDYANPPESITLAYNHSTNLLKVIAGFEKETGIIVRMVNFGSDYQRLDIKLMAGDSDFDLFVPVGMHQHKYFTSRIFEDLGQYEGLKQRFESCPVASYVSSLNGEYIGVPISIGSSYTKESNPEDGTAYSYSRIITRFLYLAQNIDIESKEYKDPDGEELYKVLKYLYENPNGNESKMPLGKELKSLGAAFVLMNRSSLKKDNAVRFLEYAFDVLSGNIEGVVDEARQYPDIDSCEEYYIEWKFEPWEIIKPITEAYKTVNNTDGKSSTLKKLAREAAAEVAMRMGE